MKLRAYQKWIRRHGWYLEKAGMDWTLFDMAGHPQVLNILISHPGNEARPMSVKKTKLALEAEGLNGTLP